MFLLAIRHFSNSEREIGLKVLPMAISIWSQSTAPLGKSIYRFVGVDAPAQFVPTLSFEAKMNNVGTNTWVKIDTSYPILATIEGVLTETSKFKMYTEFSALQNVLAGTERARMFDEHVRFLLTHKTAILNGNIVADADTPIVPNP